MVRCRHEGVECGVSELGECGVSELVECGVSSCIGRDYDGSRNEGVSSLGVQSPVPECMYHSHKMKWLSG